MNATSCTVAYVADATRIGGGEISLLELLKRLDRRRFRPVVLAYGTGRLTERLEAISVPVHQLDRSGGVRDLRLVARMAGILRRERAALLHVNSLDIRSAAAAVLAGVRLVGHLRVIFPFSWVDRAFVRAADRVFTVSRAARDALCGKAPSLKRRFSLLPNGVDDPRASALPHSPDIPRLAALIGVVGRLDPVKGVEYLIDAMPEVLFRCPGACAIVVGEPGPFGREQAYARDLERQVADKGLECAVRFLGYRNDVLAVMSELSVLVVPSVRIRSPGGITEEGFGRVAVEAMALGVPVVATRTGGLPEVLDNGKAGFLVDDADPSALAHAIVRVLNDSDLRRRLSTAGRQRYEACYTPVKHVLEVERAYASLI